MKPAIEIINLGKAYKLAKSPAYISLREMISGSVQHMMRPGKKDETFMALEDINLSIMPGERVGIIGRNGAGKSTLLKIISRITPPTTGRAVIRGRVGSLLEVGTGFHPELTGRENIFLNGSILGLKKTEIRRQLETIIAFSGVEKFIDTPLKHYSSGMQMRLAFSVAAHLQSDILLIDEVLAVGDLEFQQKCLGKMEDISREEGRTILYVSHNLDSVRRFCQKAILLQGGKLQAQGNTESMIKLYIDKQLGILEKSEWENGLVSSDGNLKLNKIWLHDRSGVMRARFDTTEDIGVSANYDVLQDNIRFTHGLNVYNQENLNIFDSHDTEFSKELQQIKKGRHQATVWIPGHLLQEGKFSINFALFLPQPLDVFLHPKDVLCFELHTDFLKPGARGNYADVFPGIIRPWLKWTHQNLST